MSNNKGWIYLDRKICDNFLWTLEPFTKGQAWLDLLLLANHKDSKINVHGNIIQIKRGQVGWSELRLAKRWKWSRNKVTRFLKLLKNEQQIEQQKSFVTSIITITNYDLYQQKGQQNGQQTIQQKDSRKTADDTQTNNVKECKGMLSNTYTSVFDTLWGSYPKKDGRKAAERHFNASVKNDNDIKDIQTALDNYKSYLAAEKIELRYVKAGSTWFNNWRDWVDYQKPEEELSWLDKKIEESKKLYIENLDESGVKNAAI